MLPAPVRSEFLQWPGSTLAAVEAGLARFLPPLDTAPEALHRAMHYAVFSGGKRLRPQLLLHVAQACAIGKADEELALRAACAVELIHIASLVHDDLPCFDDAAERRGRPTVHVLFGEATAVLVGDALLAHSIEVLTGASRAAAPRALRLVRLLVRATSSCSGLIGGQGLEQTLAHCTETAPIGVVERYHSMKTGVLFGMAAEAAAVVAGTAQPEPWRQVGNLFGRWYQLGHDLLAMRRRAPGTPGAKQALTRREERLLAECHKILAELEQRIRALAPVPEAMLPFLEALRDRMLHPDS